VKGERKDTSKPVIFLSTTITVSDKLIQLLLFTYHR